MLRLVVVYFTVFVLSLVCFQYVHAGEVQSAKVSIESFDSQKNYFNTPLFGKFHYEAKYFKGTFSSSMERLKEFKRERTGRIQKMNNHAKKDSRKLKAERKQLLRKDIVKVRPSKDWAMELSGNVAERTMVQDNYLGKISEWDASNYVEVKYITLGEKSFVTAIKIHRGDSAPMARTR